MAELISLNPLPPCDVGIGATYIPSGACSVYQNTNDDSLSYNMQKIGSSGEMAFTGKGSGTSQYCCQNSSIDSCLAFPSANKFGSGTDWNPDNDPTCCNKQDNAMDSPDNGGLVPLFQRVGYNGDPISCCLKNNACEGRGNTFSPSCYSDQGQQDTCAPQHRNMTEPACTDLISPICSGKGDTGTGWLSSWTEGISSASGSAVKCGDYIDKLLYQKSLDGSTVPQCTSIPRGEGCQPFNLNLQPPSPEGYAAAQSLVTAAVSKYNSQGFRLGAEPNTPSYTAFQEALKAVCCRYPTLCKAAILDNCANVSPDRISFNPAAREWCGCYLPDSAYQKYVDDYGINKECTPYCNVAGNVPLANVDGTAISCQQNVCLIDDVTVSIINSDVGQVNIGQFCGGCQSQQGLAAQSSCVCVIDNATVDIINSQIGGQVNIGQSCGDPVCTKRATPAQIKAGAPPILKIPCDSPSSYDPFEAYVEEQEAIRQAQQSKSVSWILLALFLIAAFFFILVLLFRKK